MRDRFSDEPLTREQQEVIDLLVEMPKDERNQLFQQLRERFCLDCGGPAGCQCWNDE